MLPDPQASFGERVHCAQDLHTPIRKATPIVNVNTTVRIEDINDAAAHDLRASLTEDPKEAATFRWIAGLIRKPVDYLPVHDADRNGEYADHRDVVEDVGYLLATDLRSDEIVRLPVRVTFQGGPQMEVGPYDLTQKDISVMRRAIEAYDRLAASITDGPPVTAETHPEFWANET